MRRWPGLPLAPLGLLSALMALGGCSDERPGPRILSVEPASGRDDRQTLIVIRGEDFNPRIAVSYDDEKPTLDTSFSARLGGDAPLEHVQLVGKGVLRAVVPSALPAGPHDLTVIDSAGRQATLPAAFTVLPSSDAGPTDSGRDASPPDAHGDGPPTDAVPDTLSD